MHFLSNISVTNHHSRVLLCAISVIRVFVNYWWRRRRRQKHFHWHKQLQSGVARLSSFTPNWNHNCWSINDAFVERTSFSLPVFSHFLWIFISKIEQPNGFSELKQLIAFYSSITTCYIPYKENRYWVSILQKFEFRHFDVWFASEQSITTYSHIHWLRQKQMLKYQ